MTWQDSRTDRTPPWAADSHSPPILCTHRFKPVSSSFSGDSERRLSHGLIWGLRKTSSWALGTQRLGKQGVTSAECAVYWGQVLLRLSNFLPGGRWGVGEWGAGKGPGPEGHWEQENQCGEFPTPFSPPCTEGLAQICAAGHVPYLGATSLALYCLRQVTLDCLGWP